MPAPPCRLPLAAAATATPPAPAAASAPEGGGGRERGRAPPSPGIEVSCLLCLRGVNSLQTSLFPPPIRLSHGVPHAP